MEHELTTEQIIAAAYRVHNTLGAGYLEKIYENAMVIELSTGYDIDLLSNFGLSVHIKRKYRQHTTSR